MAWVVLVEESEGLGRDRWRWAMTPFMAGPFADFDGAADAALRLTRDYRPQHPWSERPQRVPGLAERIHRVCGRRDRGLPLPRDRRRAHHPRHGRPA